uniref:bcl-2-binding component 3 n=1 Tax=Semicossyphus pulcher TaxID=241346 RepID=UPI0037E99257
MARAETIESVGETGGGGNGPLPRHNSCRMELPRPFHNWPSLLTTTTITTSGSGSGTGAMHPHPLQPLQALYLSYPLPYPHPEGQDEPPTHQQFHALSPSQTPPPSLHCNRREERDGVAVAHSAFSGEQSDMYRDEPLVGSSWRGPLPDLLPQNERPSLAPRREAVQELEIRRVAHQLRAIGDEYNAAVLRRAHAAPHWQDWRDACRGFLNFVTQTLSTLYRLT